MAMTTPEGEAYGPVEQPQDQIEKLFTYHAPTEEQVGNCKSIRRGAMDLARLIDLVCPEGPDRVVAMRKLREVVMTANAAIATGGGFYK